MYRERAILTYCQMGHYYVILREISGAYDKVAVYKGENLLFQVHCGNLERDYACPSQDS